MEQSELKPPLIIVLPQHFHLHGHTHSPKLYLRTSPVRQHDRPLLRINPGYELKVSQSAILGISASHVQPAHLISWYKRKAWAQAYRISLIRCHGYMATTVYCGKFSRVQIFMKIPFPHQKNFSRFNFHVKLNTPLYRRHGKG